VKRLNQDLFSLWWQRKAKVLLQCKSIDHVLNGNNWCHLVRLARRKVEEISSVDARMPAGSNRLAGFLDCFEHDVLFAL